MGRNYDKVTFFDRVAYRQSDETLSAATTLANNAAANYVVSGAAILTMTLPLASETAGSTYRFRVGSVHAHILTASQETAGDVVVTDGTTQGSRLTLPNVVGSSVVLMSEGVNWLVLGNSGSFTIDGL